MLNIYLVGFMYTEGVINFGPPQNRTIPALLRTLPQQYYGGPNIVSKSRKIYRFLCIP